MVVRVWKAVAVLALALPACNPTCNKEGVVGQEVSYRGGTTSSDGTYYQTGDWCDTWIHIPNGRTYRIEHGLRRAPLTTQIFVAFSAEPFGDDCDARGLAAPSAGNIVVVEGVTDEYIQVRNDTCETEFHFRLTAIAPDLSSADADAGAP